MPPFIPRNRGSPYGAPGSEEYASAPPAAAAAAQNELLVAGELGGAGYPAADGKTAGELTGGNWQAQPQNWGQAPTGTKSHNVTVDDYGGVQLGGVHFGGGGPGGAAAEEGISKANVADVAAGGAVLQATNSPAPATGAVNVNVSPAGDEMPWGDPFGMGPMGPGPAPHAATHTPASSSSSTPATTNKTGAAIAIAAALALALLL